MKTLVDKRLVWQNYQMHWEEWCSMWLESYMGKLWKKLKALISRYVLEIYPNNFGKPWIVTKQTNKKVGHHFLFNGWVENVVLFK